MIKLQLRKGDGGEGDALWLSPFEVVRIWGFGDWCSVETSEESYHVSELADVVAQRVADAKAADRACGSSLRATL